jgi:hypothetical protein
MHAREGVRKTIRLVVENEVDVALPVEGHILGTMLSERAKSHLFE